MRIRAEVERLYEVARESLRAVWPSVRAVAEALLDCEELDRTGLNQAIGDADIYAPVFAIQKAHRLLSVRRFGAIAEGPLVETPATRAAKRMPGIPRNKTAPEGADSRVTSLLRTLRRHPKLEGVVAAYEKETTKPGRTFGKNGLKTKGGKLFALFTQGTLVVKLPNERVAALVAQGVGTPFDPGHGRLMKGWLTVANPKASWVELTEEAHEFVEGVR